MAPLCMMRMHVTTMIRIDCCIPYTAVEHVDLYPTISALAGIPVDPADESIEGSSYAALFDNPRHAIATSRVFQAAYTQYPRCNAGSMPIDVLKNIRCAFVSKRDFKYMGYSLRTPTWRYTEYAAWDGEKLCPMWNSSVPCVYSELYDHTGDGASRLAIRGWLPSPLFSSH